MFDYLYLNNGNHTLIISMNMMKAPALLQSKNKWWLLIFACIICLAYQFDNIPRTDDEYLGEQVYWLLQKGKVRSDFGYSDLGYNIYQSFFHKLFVYSGYVFSRVFGWSLYSLHAASYVCFLMFLVVFFRYTRQLQQPEYPLFFGALILMLFNQDLLYAIGDFRPEVMIMTLGFAAYSALKKYLDQGKQASFICSAICAGLCMFAHLNGVIFIIAGCLVLLFKRRFTAAILYGITAVLAFLPYFADVLYHADLAYFWHQVSHDPILTGSTKHWYDPLLQIINEQTRFLFTEKQIILTATLVVTLVFSLKKLMQSNNTLLAYTLILIVSLAVVCPSKSTKYMVLYLPFLYLILVEGWLYIEDTGKRKKIIPLRCLIVSGMAVSLFYSGKQISENIENLRSGGLIAEHKTLADKIPGDHKKQSLLAPRIMVFNEIGKFNRLEDIGMVSVENLTDYITHSDIDYVIFSLGDKAYFHFDEMMRGKNAPLLLLGSTEHYTLTAVKR